MLLNINEDCFYAICRYLNLTDHLVLSTVCKDLQELMSIQFQRKCNSKTLETPCWNTANKQFQIPKYVLSLMENSSDSVFCDTDELYKYKDSLRNLKFERVTTIMLTASKIRPLRAGDLEALIGNLFPCLYKLILEENFNDMRFFYLQSVEELEIHCTPGEGIWDMICFSDFKKITFRERLRDIQDFKQLTRCTELEELSMNRMDYDEIVLAIGFKHVMRLRMLTLTAAESDYELCLNQNYFYRLIDGVRFNVSSSVKLIDANLSKLRHLMFVNDDGTTLKAFSELNATEWSTLEEIYYLHNEANSDIEEQQELLLFMASHCPKLRVLDISWTNFDNRFVEELAKVKNEQTGFEKLLLRCHKCENITTNFRTPYLIVSFQKIYYFLPERNEIHIELKAERRTRELLQYLRDLMETFKENDSGLGECLEILDVVEEDFQGIEPSLLDLEVQPLIEAEDHLTESQLVTKEKLRLVRSELERSSKTILERFWLE